MAEEADILELEKQLTERERRFVAELELAGDGNGTQAAIRAGYKPGKENRQAATAASRLLKNDKVLAYRRARAKQRYAALGISPEYVAAELISVYRRCMQAEPVMGTDPETCSPIALGKFEFDARGALKALELIGDSMGMFKKGVELDADGGMAIEINVVGASG